MQKVFVLDTIKTSLAPCHPARARELLMKGKAAVYRRYPFTIILKRVVENPAAPTLRLKIDPGSKITGLAIVDEDRAEVIWAGEIAHRGYRIKTRMDARRAIRRGRRNRKIRHRQPRFENRTRPVGWLPPSLLSRVWNVETWVQRLRVVCPISAISMELVRFDTQALENPEVSGIEYQQGELLGYEVREYLLEKWGRKCVYCGMENIPLQVEHIVPKNRGGTNRVSNLTIACVPCNQKKSNQTAGEFGFPGVQAQAKKPLKDVAAINVTRWALFEALRTNGLPVEVGTGGRTKWNRKRLGLEKTHWLDAACVGALTPEGLKTEKVIPLQIKAMGHGNRQMCCMDRFGFPRTSAKQFKRVHGFQTGDRVQATVPKGKHKGVHQGRVVVRSSGSFCIGNIDGISWRYCRKLHCSDGYDYQLVA